MKKCLAVLLLSLAAVAAIAGEIEKFPDSQEDSKLVLLLNPGSAFVQALGAEGNAYVTEAAIVDETGAPSFAGWLGVRESDCAKGKGAMVFFFDKEQRQVASVTGWGIDPNNVFTKVAKRICALGRKSAGI